MNRTLALIATLAVGLGFLTAAPASAATDPVTACYWNITTQAYADNSTWTPAPLPLGTKVCYVETGATWEWAPNVNRYVHPAALGDPATDAPTLGGERYSWPRTVAERTRRMAADEGAILQFANRDLAGRGCFWNGAASAAQFSDGEGNGFIRMGNSGRTDCNDDLSVTLSTAAHELAHLWIEKLCGTTSPPMATGRDRMEDVTSALGYLHFDDEVASYGGTIVKGSYTSNDIWRAKQLIAGRCE